MKHSNLWSNVIETKRRKAVHFSIQVKMHTWELPAAMVLALWIKQIWENKSVCRESENNEEREIGKEKERSRDHHISGSLSLSLAFSWFQSYEIIHSLFAWNSLSQVSVTCKRGFRWRSFWKVQASSLWGALEHFFFPRVVPTIRDGSENLDLGDGGTSLREGLQAASSSLSRFCCLVFRRWPVEGGNLCHLWQISDASLSVDFLMHACLIST